MPHVHCNLTCNWAHASGRPPLNTSALPAGCRIGFLRFTLTRRLPAVPSNCIWVLSYGGELEAGGRLVRDADTAAGLHLRSNDCLYISLLKVPNHRPNVGVAPHRGVPVAAEAGVD